MIRTNVPNRNRFSKPHPAKMETAKNALANAIKPRPDFFIESLTHNEIYVEVFYVETSVLESGMVQESDWRRARILFKDIMQFANERYSVRSGIINGAETFEVGLRVIAKAYLEAGKEITNV